MSVNRRRARSARAWTSVGLLLLAGLLLVAAVLRAERLMLSAAAIGAYLAGVAAARILSNDHAMTRRAAARDRAALAQQYAGVFAARVEEQDEFASAMVARLASRDSAIAELRGNLGAATRRLRSTEALARREAERATALRARMAELESRVAKLSGDLDEQQTLTGESLAFWYGRQDPGVEDLLDWEAQAAAARKLAARKQA